MSRSAIMIRERGVGGFKEGLEAAATLGHSYAQAILSGMAPLGKRLALTFLSAAQGDRWGCGSSEIVSSEFALLSC